MRVRRLAPIALALAVCASAAKSTAEDLDPNALFESAKAAYAEKKYGKSLSELKLLIGEVGRRRAEAVKPLLPAAPAGWTAAETEAKVEFAAMAFFNQGMGLERSYSKGDSSVRLELWADSPMVASIAATFSMAQMMGQTVVKVKGRNALLNVDKDSKSGDLTLLLASNTAMLKLSGNGVTKDDLVTTFGNALDLDALEKALAE